MVTAFLLVAASLVAQIVDSPPAGETERRCHAVLGATAASDFTAEYSVSNREAHDGWRVGPNPVQALGELGAYVELSEWLADDKVSVRELTDVRCDNGGLVVHGSVETDLDTLTQVSHSFEPALQWLPLPLETGSSWVWSGTYEYASGDAGNRIPASMYGFVGDARSVSTPLGEYQCHEVTTELVLYLDSSQSTIRSESCVSVDPYYVVVERTRTFLGLQQGPTQEFTLLRQHQPEREPTPEAPPIE